MSQRRPKDRSHWGDAAFKAMHDKPITQEVLHEALREPTARELTKSLGFGMAGYVLDDGERLAGRVEKVLALHAGHVGGICDECGAVIWPCATVRILNGEEP